jgi:hypothetical protein
VEPIHEKKPPSFIIAHVLPHLWEFIPFLMIDCDLSSPPPPPAQQKKSIVKYEFENGKENGDLRLRAGYLIDKDEDEKRKTQERKDLYEMKKRNYDNVKAEEERTKMRRKFIGDYKTRSL